jgi:DNA-binding transcriptional MerR regulator
MKNSGASLAAFAYLNGITFVAMPLKEKTIERMYWSIGEVADTLGVNASLLRYWEKEFGTLRPKRTSKGDRLYTKDDIEQLRRIQHLVKEKGFTLQGAKGQLRKRAVPEAPVQPVIPLDEVRSALLRVREKLIALVE